MEAKKDLKKRKSSVFRKMAVSYIVMLIVSVLVTGGVAYYKTYSIVYDNIQEANLGSILNLEQKMASFTRETDELALSLQGWPAIKKMFTMSGRRSGSLVNDEELFNLVYVLRKHKAMHSYIDNMAIVFRDVDMVIDCNSFSSTYEEFFGYRFFFEAEGFQGVEDIDFAQNSRLVSGCRFGKYSPPNQDCILYFRAIPNTSGVHKAMLMVIMKPENMQNQLNSSVVLENEMWLIRGEDGKVILAGTECSEEELERLPIPEEGESRAGYALWQGTRSACYYVKPESMDYIFYTFFPVNHILGQFLGTFLFMALSLVVIITVGILFAWHCAKRSYAPIQRLASSAAIVDQGDKRINEYSLIEESLEYLSSENDVLRESISTQMPILRNNLLNRLLSSTTVREADREELEKYAITFPHAWFLVSMVSVEAMRLHPDEEMIDSPAFSALFLSCIKEYFSEQNMVCYLAETQNENNAYAMIINSDTTDTELFRSLFGGFPDFLRKKLSASVDVDVSIGISRMASGPVNFKALYYQALHALEYRHFLSCPRVVWYEDLKETVSVSYNFTLNDELKLGNLLKSGQKAEALEYVNAVLDDFFAQGKVRREDALYIFNQILFICAKTIHETQASFAEIVDFKKLYSLMLFTQMNEYTLACVEATCDSVKDRQKAAESELSRKIVRYIGENFRSCDMTLTFLADYFNVSSIYVSKSVKKVAEINFIDYLHRLRIDEAKRLLRETGQSIREIGAQMGYDSDKNFIRVFKKYEGITPGQYRKNE